MTDKRKNLEDSDERKTSVFKERVGRHKMVHTKVGAFLLIEE